MQTNPPISDNTSSSDSGTSVVDRLKKYLGKTITDNPSLFGRWLNGTLLEVEKGSMTFSFEVRPDMTNGLGTLHGGVTSGIMDEVMGLTVATYGYENFYVTVTLNIDYLSGAKAGDKVIAVSKTIREGRNIANVNCEIKHLDGKIIARGTSNLIKTEIKKRNA